ncbi:MAG: SUMF1/EgtB/PvdO family nonheme iron enzyme [Pseudomonadota bacterium]|nr:SUMF1/EgtB/PvdO family nonheme iron enzyme [Pseudomonadota bacterium]
MTDAANRYGRYEDRGLLGEGGMAQVRRVWDATLGRTVAMKILRAEYGGNAIAEAAFEAETRIIARLQHPGLIPIHETGRLADGRLYYTMKEVQGRTLRQVLRDVHAASRDGVWGEAAGGWTLRRLIEACHRACEAMAYAHACGVLHRDLKPDNVMLGAFGEVLVLDWGLAALVDAKPREPDLEDTRRSTRTGPSGVRGTVAYMPPEQARADTRRVQPASDVYSLGATLYEVLSGQPPYRGKSSWAVMMQLNTHPPEPIGAVLAAARGPTAPPELVQLVETAMARDPEARYPDAGRLAAGIGEWLDGARRREQALALVAEADALTPRIEGLRAEAKRLKAEAAETMKAIRPWQPAADKREAWALDDTAAQREQEARRAEVDRLQALRAALNQSPEIPEALERLADYYQARHAAAELVRDHAKALESEALLRAHDRGRWASWLRGDGAVTLHTDPPGAEVELYRYVLEDRRLVPVHVRALGPTPLVEVPLSMGSWLLTIHAPGRGVVRYPVSIGRNEHWDGVPPGGTDPAPVPLPAERDLSPLDVYIPPGWYWAGGDPEAPSVARRRLWVDALVFRRFQVTNAEWITFLDALVAEGREEEALRHAPRERGAAGAPGAMIYARDAEGRFVLQPDADGDRWEADYSVLMVDWHDCAAYARWYAAHDGQAWRLPGELEWEKAARGVDGRFLPWGDVLDPSWCLMAESQPGRPMPQSIYTFPTDESPFGVRNVAGNARVYCGDLWRPDGPPTPDGRVSPPHALGDAEDHPGAHRVWRGGSWLDNVRGIRTAGRSYGPATDRYGRLGCRLMRSY